MCNAKQLKIGLRLLIVALSGLLVALVTPASAQVHAVPPNVAVAANTQDGSELARTTFVVHQVELLPDGSALVTSNPDLGDRRKPVRVVRDPRGGQPPDRGSTSTRSGLSPEQAQASAQAAVNDLVSSWAPDPTTGLYLPNVAVAYNACNDCATMAAAVEVVFVSGAGAPLFAHNVAVSINDQCVRCVAGAYAYQLIIVTRERLTLDRPMLNALYSARRKIEHAVRLRLDRPMEKVIDELAKVTQRLEDSLEPRIR